MKATLYAVLCLGACDAPSDDGPAVPAHCEVRTDMYRTQTRWIRTSPDLFPNDSMITVTGIDGCGFDASNGTDVYSVQCSAPDVPNGLEVDRPYRYSSCAVWAPLDELALVVMRDPDGQLVMAGGTGPDPVDVPCVPAELSVTLVEDGCPAVDSEAFCGPVHHVALRVAHGADAVTLWPGEQGTLTIEGATYDVINFFSYREDVQRCSDAWHQAVSWAIIRRVGE